MLNNVKIDRVKKHSLDFLLSLRNNRWKRID